MKNLSLIRLETTVGGKLTKEEVADFIGAASCTLTLFGGPHAIFSGMECAKWLFWH